MQPIEAPPTSTADWLEWSHGLRTDFPEGETLPEIFAAWVRRTPEAPAVMDGNARWSYRQLDHRSNSVARDLVRRGVKPGDFVGLPAIRSGRFVAQALGTLKAGAAYVPIDPDEPQERQNLRRRDCALVLGEEAPGEDPDGVSLRGASARDPAYLLYTSGSTGEPKGVIVPHCAISRLVCQTDYLQIEPNDVFALHSNLSFDASTLELWGPLLNGASLTVTSPDVVLSPEALAEHLSNSGITILWLTTSLFNRLVQEAPGLFAKLRALLFGGEAADAASVRRVLEHGKPVSLINGYGPTETTTFAVCHRVARIEGTRVPIGRPIANTDAYVLDVHLRLALEGELHIGGPGLALGYLRQPELTAARFIETEFGRLYKTGDLVRWAPDGTLEYLGRLDRQLKIRGHRIEPGEIEAALREEPGVSACVVTARRAPSGEQILAAYYTGAAREEALRASLKSRLPSQMNPACFIRMETLPLTVNGKLDHAALPPPRLGDREMPSGAVRPQSVLQNDLAAVWQDVLGLASCGIDDNFFDLGGSSLLLLRLHSRLQERLGRDLRPTLLFQHPTIRSLAEWIESGGGSGHSTAPARDRAAKQRAALARQRLVSKR